MSTSIHPGPNYVDPSKANLLVEKWGPILDYKSDSVSPITDDHTRLNTAILLENQERWCLGEAVNAAGGSGSVFGSVNAGAYGGAFGNNDSYAAGDARLPKILIPMIRRTFPELITNEIVGVQPMSGPVGLAFALRYRYEADNLGDYKVDGLTGTNAPAGPYRSDGTEIGWNYLNTAHTGITSASLSGNADFEMISNDQGVAELLANFELSSRIPQMVLAFEKTAVEAGTRRLAARWSVELEQDIKNMNGIDIDNELTNAMSYEIQAEIDREMVMRMIQVCLNAGTGTGAAAKGYSFWNAASADARWLGERNRDFYARCIIEANRIAIRNRRGSANFIIATPRVAAMLEMLPEFTWMSVQGNVNTQPIGVARVGSVGGRFQVYRDTRTEAQFNTGAVPLRTTQIEYALLGYKGPEYYDTGIIYCPYIPVMIQRTVGPNDFAPRVGLMTRYGVVDNLFGAELYYHLIIVRGNGTAFIPGQAAVYL
jgi:hypothetical protein